ncbi:MAG TPA: mobile mystery protein B [Candidatus Didemnitutus sp.]|nr:mobile mystery protein B [Candidatus Didemnitutus sp.]
MSDIFQSKEHETPLGAEEKRELIPSLSTRAELNEAERANILEARIWAMRRRTLKREDLVTDAFARELHRRMFAHVWQWAGCYRKTERNLGWEVHRLTEGVHNAFADAQTWLQYATYPLPETAVRLHHQLVRVHPWPNGNGRHARLMADVLLQSRDGGEFTWGAGGDIVSPGQARTKYIEAIRQADAGDYGPLIEFAKS